MEPRKGELHSPPNRQVSRQARKRKLQIVKLEERIAPKLATNHNETMVRQPAKLEIVKLEERITPTPTIPIPPP